MEGDTMLETYFSAPKTLRRLRAGPSGPFIDAFAASLQADGYSPATTARYLRAAAHLGHFLEQRGRTLTNIDQSTVAVFFRHFADCRCPLSNGGKRNHHTYFGASDTATFWSKLPFGWRERSADPSRR
jgi:hypothetical protein